MPYAINVIDTEDAEWFARHTSEKSRQEQQKQRTDRQSSENVSPRVIVEARDVYSEFKSDRGFVSQHHRQQTDRYIGTRSQSATRGDQHHSDSASRNASREGRQSHRSRDQRDKNRSRTLSPVRNTDRRQTKDNIINDRESVEIVLTPVTSKSSSATGSSGSKAREQSSPSTHNSSPTTARKNNLSHARGFDNTMSPIYNKVRQRDSLKNHHVKSTQHSNTEEGIPLDRRNRTPESRPIYDYPTEPGHSGSSISSMESSTAHFKKPHHNAVASAAHQQQQQHSHGSRNSSRQNPPGLRLDPDRYLDRAILKKQRQSQLQRDGIQNPTTPNLKLTRRMGTDISSTDGGTPAFMTSPRSISENSIAASPNIIYQALQSGNSETMSQFLSSPHNLSVALKESASEASSIFRDFRNPTLETHHEDHEEADDEMFQLLPKPPSTLTRERRSILKEDDLSVVTGSNSVLKQRLVLKSESQSFDSSEEMSYYHFVSRHSILQLCTEDLMSDNWKLVDYALYRLCEVCCTATLVGNDTPGSEEGLQNTANTSNNATSADQLQQQNAAATNRIRFIKAGGHALIVGVMKKFSKVADLQTSACRLIQNLISLDKEGAFKELFSSVYGLDCVLVAIQQFPLADNVDTNDEVHRYACGALVAMVCSSFKMVQRLMQDPRNLRVFLEAMHASIDAKHTVGVCRVIHYISKYPDYHAAIWKAGGVEDVIGEMKVYPGNKNVQCSGCEALGNLVQGRSATEAMVDHVVNQLEGAHLIGVAMKSFPNWEDLQEKASYCIYHLSAYRSVQVTIKKAAGLSALGVALENFPKNLSIQQHGSAAIKRLLETGVSSASGKTPVSHPNS